MEEEIIATLIKYAGSGAAGIIVGIAGTALTAIGIIRNKKNDKLYMLAYKLFRKADRWGENKLGALWRPIENHLPSGLMIIAKAARDALLVNDSKS